MFSKLRGRFRSDRGDSTLVSTIIVMPLIIGILITMIDVSVYFSNRGQMLNIVRDAARQVAIFGGDGTATMATPLEYAYGVTRNTSCAGLSSSPVVSQAYNPTTSSAIECSLLNSISKTAGFVSITVNSVQCGAADSSGNFTGSTAISIGSQVGCQVSWQYNSIPGSGLGFLQALKATPQITKVNATSEVSQNGILCQNWTTGAFGSC